MTNIQAALGVAQMEKIDKIIMAKNKLAAAYSNGLRSVPGIQLPPEAVWAENVYWLYCILVHPQVFGMSRNELMGILSEQEIETRPLFPPLHTQPIYNTGQSLPVAEHLSASGVSLPSAVTLSTHDLARTIQVIRNTARSPS